MLVLPKTVDSLRKSRSSQLAFFFQCWTSHPGDPSNLFLLLSQISLHFILTHTCCPLAVQVRFTSQVHDGVKQQSHCRFTRLDTLGQSQSLLHIPADGLQTVLELVITVVLLLAACVVAAVMLVTAFCHGWDTYIKLKAKHRGSTSIGWGWFVPRPRHRLVSITASVVAQPVVSSEQVQGCVQVRVNLVDPVSYRFQRVSPVRSLRLIFTA